MRRSNLLTPVSVLLAGCVLIALLVFQPDAGSRAAPRADITDYPPPTQTAFALQTQTAEAGELSDKYPNPGQTSTGATTTGATARPTATLFATGTTTTSSTQTPATTSTSEGLFNAETPTRTTGNQATPTTEARTATTTPTPTQDPNLPTCIPGQTLTISGEGPPNAGFLLYFNKRVVSGGTVGRDGTFTIGLTVGMERGGSYPVEVRVRGSRQLLRSLTCQVPETTPTPPPSPGTR